MLFIPFQAIAFAGSKYDGHFDYISSVEDVTVNDSRGLIMDGCRVASDVGVTDLVFTDLDGSFKPDGSDATGGSLVSDYSHVIDIFEDGACSSVGNCLAYCPGLCLRTLSYKVEQFGTENWKLRVSYVHSL